MLKLDLGIVWIFVNIIVLFLFFKFFLFKPVMAIMLLRQNAIADSIKDAEDKKSEAYKLKSEYEAELRGAAEQATIVIKEARVRGDIEYSKILKEAKEEATRVITDASMVIELERKKSMESAQAEIAGIAMLAAAKIIGKNVDEDTSKKFLGDFLNEVGAGK